MVFEPSHEARHYSRETNFNIAKRNPKIDSHYFLGHTDKECVLGASDKQVFISMGEGVKPSLCVRAPREGSNKQLKIRTSSCRPLE